MATHPDPADADSGSDILDSKDLAPDPAGEVSVLYSAACLASLTPGLPFIFKSRRLRVLRRLPPHLVDFHIAVIQIERFCLVVRGVRRRTWIFGTHAYITLQESSQSRVT
jgi:hypothetical protein